MYFKLFFNHTFTLLKVQNVSDHYYPASNNSERLFYHKFIQQVRNERNSSNLKSKPDFETTISFYEMKINYSREDNLAKLIQNGLNCLSLWLNICILDACVYLYDSICFVLSAFEIFLKNFKIGLKRNI